MIGGLLVLGVVVVVIGVAHGVLKHQARKDADTPAPHPAFMTEDEVMERLDP